MDRLRLPATVGTLVSLVTAAVVLAPYVLIDADGSTIATYYDYGLLSGVTVMMVALVAVVVFASGRQGRSDPATAAGAALGLGIVATVLAALWALAVPEEVVFQLTTEEWFEYHRWAVLGSAVAMAICGVWYAWVLRLF